MNTWRQILSWKNVDTIEVGDTVEVIATPELLETIGIYMPRDPIGIKADVSEINPDGRWALPFYQGRVNVSDWFFPYSHWREFLKVVEKAPSERLSWQLPPEPEKRAVDDILDPLGAPVALDYHSPMEKVQIICPWCTSDVGQVEPTSFGDVYNEGFNLIRDHMPNCPNKNAKLKDMMVFLRGASTESSLKFSWKRQELKNGLNTDVARRDQIIFKNSHAPVSNITATIIDLDTLEKLVAENFIDLQGAQNDSPTTAELLAFMRRFPEVRAYIYAVPLERDDYRVTIEGLIYRPLTGQVPDALAEAFDEFSTASEYKNEPAELRCWWD